jgi:hypothetical protein
MKIAHPGKEFLDELSLPHLDVTDAHYPGGVYHRLYLGGHETVVGE